jgi:hypothetical protein
MKRKLAAVALCSLSLTVGCGADSPDGEAIAGETEALLTIPGPFYVNPPGYAWCTVTNADLVSGECHAGYSFNSGGSPGSHTKFATGRYRVTLPGQLDGGNVQITAAGTNAHCNLVSARASGGAELVDVACFAPSGALVNSRFVVSYYRETNVGGQLGAYAFVRGGATPSLTNVWNSTGSGASVSRSAPGVYRVAFPGQSFGGDTVHVTSAGSGYCKVATFTAGVVDVRCFSLGGVAADMDVSVFSGKNVRGEPRNTLPTGVQGGFSRITAAAVVEPTFSRNTCTTGSNTAVATGVGTYLEKYHAITAFPGEVPIGALVTAYGPDSGYCNLLQPPIQGVRSDSTLLVQCFRADGTKAPSAHTSMVFLKDAGGSC